jgi:hypothetical protein
LVIVVIFVAVPVVGAVLELNKILHASYADEVLLYP